MRLASKHDVEVPLDFVWRVLTDFEHFEHLAAGRGVRVEPVQKWPEPAQGQAWTIRFVMRGKPRSLNLRLESIEPGERLSFGFDSAPAGGEARLELLALAPGRTRLSLILEAKPKTLAARIFIQTLRLAKNRTQRKFDSGLAKLGKLIKTRWRDGGGA